VREMAELHLSERGRGREIMSLEGENLLVVLYYYTSFLVMTLYL